MSYKPVNYLEKGDLVYILCTARSAQKDSLQPAIKALEQQGLSVICGDTIGKIEHQQGGSIQQRVDDFNNALSNPDVKAIWIARGGYGTIQILDLIDFNVLLKYPKWIIGYSDITLIHSKIINLGLESIHGLMPMEWTNKSLANQSSFIEVLFNPVVKMMVPNDRGIKPQEIQGTLIGGNLSILYSLLGSDDFPKTHNSILFIEEIDEYLYHFERMLYSLHRAGVLSQLKAIVVGGLTSMNDHDIPFGKTAIQIIEERTAQYSYPVIYNIPAGHVENNQSLIMGRIMNISIEESRITLTQ